MLIIILVKKLNMIQNVLEFARNNKRLFMKLTKWEKKEVSHNYNIWYFDIFVILVDRSRIFETLATFNMWKIASISHLPKSVDHACIEKNKKKICSQIIFNSNLKYSQWVLSLYCTLIFCCIICLYKQSQKLPILN